MAAPNLHDYVRDIGRIGQARDQTQRQADIEQLLGDGHDPNALDAHEMSPLAILAENQGGNLWAAKIARLLMHKGANPLLNDRAFAKASGAVASEMMAYMVAKELLGEGLRGEDGENPLHQLAEDNPVGMIEALSFFPVGLVPAELYPFLGTWLKEARPSDGASPMHCLWAEGSNLEGRMEAGMDFSEEADAAWHCLARAQMVGLDMGQVDAAGKSIAQVFMEAAENGAEAPNDVDGLLREVQAVAGQAILDKATGLANKPRAARRV